MSRPLIEICPSCGQSLQTRRRCGTHWTDPTQWMRGWRFVLVCALLLASVLLQCMVSGCSLADDGKQAPAPQCNDQFDFCRVSEGGQVTIDVDGGTCSLWCWYNKGKIVDCECN